MPFFKDNLNTKTLSIAGALIAVAALAGLALGQLQAPEAAAQTTECRTENVSSINLSADSQSSNGSTVSDSDSDSLNLNSYLSGNEYINKISFFANLYTNEIGGPKCDGGGSFCQLTASARVVSSVTTS